MCIINYYMTPITILINNTQKSLDIIHKLSYITVQFHTIKEIAIKILFTISVFTLHT